MEKSLRTTYQANLSGVIIVYAVGQAKISYERQLGFYMKAELRTTCLGNFPDDDFRISQK